MSSDLHQWGNWLICHPECTYLQRPLSFLRRRGQMWQYLNVSCLLQDDRSRQEDDLIPGSSSSSATCQKTPLPSLRRVTSLQRSVIGFCSQLEAAEFKTQRATELFWGQTWASRWPIREHRLITDLIISARDAGLISQVCCGRRRWHPVTMMMIIKGIKTEDVLTLISQFKSSEACLQADLFLSALVLTMRSLLHLT